MHLGDGHWILIDSCIHPRTKRAATLAYLQEVSVDVATKVKLIVVTHWDDDHVRGLTEIVTQCPTTQVWISGALQVDEFRTLIGLSGEPRLQTTGTDEFARVFDTLKARKRSGAPAHSVKLAIQDRLLYRQRVLSASGGVEAKLYSLSPSDAAMLQAQLAFGRLLPRENERPKRVSSPTPNHASVALFLDIGEHQMLLGADLETTTHPQTGWTVILDESRVITGQAGAFKIPHHGAASAHHDRVWSELLVEQPFAVTTPFIKGNQVIPTAIDRARILGLTPNAYLTAPARRRQHKWTKRVVADFVQRTTRDIHNVHSGWGHVRLRQRIESPPLYWLHLSSGWF